MSEPDEPRADRPVLVGAEPVAPRDPKLVAHLAENRRLVVRRSLLATALGGVIPLPVMDDFVAGRVRAGLYMRLAGTRHVDLPQSAADLLADPRDGTALRNATLTAATLLALKLAWRKFFALLAAGRGAEEMATTFQFATLVDHYCARLHVGGAVSRARAAQMRKMLFATIDQTEKAALVAVFRDGARVLGKSALEAPRWVSQRLRSYAERWAQSGGNPQAPVDLPGEDSDAGWLDRATRAVDESLGALGNEYLGVLVERFEERWRARPPDDAAAAADPSPEPPPDLAPRD